MFIFDSIRNFFLKKQEPPSQDWQQKNNFRNPIWQNDDDDDEDDYGDFRSRQNRRMQSGFSDGMFSSDELMENIFEEFLGSFMQSFGGQRISMDLNFSPTVPEFEEIKRPNLRDTVLKKDSTDERTPKDVTKFFGNDAGNDPASDIQNPETTNSCSKLKVYISNGMNGFKEQRIVDCDGSVTTIIQNQTPDNLHTVTITKDKNGVETVTENTVPLNKNQLNNMYGNWNVIPIQPFNYFDLLDSFFGPKL